MQSKPYFIVNPHSSNGRTGRIWPHFQGILERRFGPLHCDLTRSVLHARELASRALQNGYDLVLAVGGDGTINEVLNGFFRDGAPLNPRAVLGYLSSGTGGDLSRTFGYHDCPLERQAELLLDGRVRRHRLRGGELPSAPTGSRSCAASPTPPAPASPATCCTPSTASPSSSAARSPTRWGSCAP